MKFHRRNAGFTLIELVFVIGLLCVLFTFVYELLELLSRASGRAASSAAEIALAAKMSETFRDDVRQASSAECSATGDRAKLRVGDVSVEYLTNDSGRIERHANGKLDFVGPLVLSSKFAFQAARETSQAMVLATWTCRADVPAETPGQFQPAGRVLVLDTALRAEVKP